MVYRRRNWAPEKIRPDRENKENDLQNPSKAWVCSPKHFMSTLVFSNRWGRWHSNTFSWKIFSTSFAGDVPSGDSGRPAVRMTPFPSLHACLSHCDFLILLLEEGSVTYIRPPLMATKPASPCCVLVAMGTGSRWPAGDMREQTFGTYLYQKLILADLKLIESLISSVSQHVEEIPDSTTLYWLVCHKTITGPSQEQQICA